nr:hypothetical protein [Tanacetum cinerariifolium]
MASLLIRRVSSPSKTSIKAFSVLRKDLPRIRGTRRLASKSTTTKSAGKWNFPTFTKTSSATQISREINRSASLRVIKVGVSSGRESLFHTDNGMRFMLASRSARVKHSSISGKSHRMRNLSGSPSFSDGYGIDGFWLGFEALTGATTGSEFRIEVSIWTTGGREKEVVGIVVLDMQFHFEW